MEFRDLGRSVLQVTTLGLGTNSFGHRIGAEWHLTPKEMLEIKALLDGPADSMGG